MSALVGHRIREILTISESFKKPMSYSEFHSHVLDGNPRNTSKYCERAVSQGLMTRSGENPRKYMAVANWKELVGIYKKPGAREKKFVHKLPKKIINSVFALGEL